jgi:phospholipid-binding lipoprotein MlaA
MLKKYTLINVPFFLFFLLLLCTSSLSWAQEEEAEVWDPIEPVNRGIFWFNDKLDNYIAEPIAKGYNYITPDEVQASISNFFRNLAWPSYLLDDIVALDAEGAGVHTGRFLINSTAGVLGFFDIASDMGLKHKEVDLGMVLARYGVGEGPYLVIPVLGPSNLRDIFGTTVDGLADPLTLATYTDLEQNEKNFIFFGGNGVRLINRRAALLEAVDSAKEGALDYYLFVQSAYKQRRDGTIKGEDFTESDASSLEKDEFLPEE